MSVVNGSDPKLKGVHFETQVIAPDDSQEEANSIKAGVKSVRLAANVTDANDFTVLPSLGEVQNGDIITIIAGAANSELRTPDASAEEINSEDCDGTKEALLTATNIYTVTKIDDTIGWMLKSFTAVGTVVASITPN